MAMKRFSKAKLPKMGKRPMMMALTALVIIFLFWFFFMRGGRSEGFREGAGKKAAIDEQVKKDKAIIQGKTSATAAEKKAAEDRRPNIAAKAKAGK
jgi:hypothetical protein